MTGILQLTDQLSPTAQTFRVNEPGGSVLTGIGLFFHSAPASSDEGAAPITIELRPVAEGGNPSATRFIPGTRVSATGDQVSAVSSTTFGAGTEYKFTFREPVYVQHNKEYAIVISTAATVGLYKLWGGVQGDHEAGSTTKLITSDLNAGVMFRSSNGTAWSKDQFSDLAFKVYRAVFEATGNQAVMYVDLPPQKRLTESNNTNRATRYPTNPLVMTASSNEISVIHPSHGFIVGDKVKLSADSDGIDSADTVNGISAAQILKTQTITKADPYGYSFDVTSNATNTERAGGSSMLATEQYVIDQVMPVIPKQTPPYTSMYASGTFTTWQPYQDEDVNAYQTTSNVPLKILEPTLFKNPHVIASHAQEQESSKLNGEPSTKIVVGLDTDSKYVAPYFNANASSLRVISNFIDHQQSTDSDYVNRNNITTLAYTTEYQPDGGTSAAKHITIPYQLSDEGATSIRVLLDAIRPTRTEFDIYYRTSLSTDERLIGQQPWVKFSKNINSPNSSNYSQQSPSMQYREYFFNVYDLPLFDQYQLKITMHSQTTSVVPIIKNLRTIATV